MNYCIRMHDKREKLIWMERLKSTNNRLARWSLALQLYNFQDIHKAGKLNGNADALIVKSSNKPVVCCQRRGKVCDGLERMYICMVVLDADCNLLVCAKLLTVT